MNDGMYVTIDADTIIYLISYQHRDNEDVDLVLQDTDKYIRTLLDNTAATYYAGFIGGTKCFRYDIAVTKPYKGNRPPSPDWFIKWSGIIKAHLRDEWNFKVVNGIEADDAVCIYQTWCRENSKNSIMCHGDKDLYQIEGNHYDIRKHTRKYVTELDGLKSLYTQLLVGDVSDSVSAIYGIGPKKAFNLLDHLNDEMEMHDVVKAMYEKTFKDEALNRYAENYRLLALLRHSNTLNVSWSKYEPNSTSEEPEIDLTGLIWD